MAMIEVEDLRKNYGSLRALDGVSFRVERGEILGFLGPNGAGKTTTMKILTGLLNPSGGKARIGDLDVTKDGLAVRRRIGYLPESTPLYEDLTVAEYLRHCGHLRGMRGKGLLARVEAVCTLTDLWPKYRAPIKTLSKGYRQRTGIAQALLHEPEVIILDEPTVGLDPNQVVEVRSLIRSVGQECTVILCSHILPEVEATCDRVVIIHQGRIAADGRPDELKAQHQNTRHFTLEVNASGHDLAEKLRSVEQVGSFRITKDIAGQAGARFEAAGEDAANAAAAALTDAGLEITRMDPDQTSLEDVFRALTKQEAKS